MDEKFVLYTIVAPVDPNTEPKIYYVEKGHFTSNRSDAHTFNSRQEVMDAQKECEFVTYIESL